MWRGVLGWGQAKAGVKGTVKQWTDSDRTRMKQVLNVSFCAYYVLVYTAFCPILLSIGSVGACSTDGDWQWSVCTGGWANRTTLNGDDLSKVHQKIDSPLYFQEGILEAPYVWYCVDIGMLQYMVKVSLHRRNPRGHAVAVQMHSLAQHYWQSEVTFRCRSTNGEYLLLIFTKSYTMC